MIVSCNIKVDLLIPINWVGSMIVILYKSFTFYLEEPLNIRHRALFFENNQEVNVSVMIFFGKGNIRLYFKANGWNNTHNFLNNILVFLRCKMFCILKCVSPHNNYYRISFIYIINNGYSWSIQASVYSSYSPYYSSYSLGSDILAAIVLSVNDSFHDFTQEDTLSSR
jgi:hypothetical protein